MSIFQHWGWTSNFNAPPAAPAAPVTVVPVVEQQPAVVAEVAQPAVVLESQDDSILRQRMEEESRLIDSYEEDAEVLASEAVYDTAHPTLG